MQKCSSRNKQNQRILKTYLQLLVFLTTQHQKVERDYRILAPLADYVMIKPHKCDLVKLKAG